MCGQVLVLSDKLFYWIFQSAPDWIIGLLDDLPVDATGYSFSAPVLKAREHRLDGLFLPPLDRPDLPASILEAEAALPESSRELREAAVGSTLEADLNDLIAAILITRFPSRSILEVCAMGGITVEDFSQSRIYQEKVGRKAARPRPSVLLSASSRAAAAVSAPQQRRGSRTCLLISWSCS